MTRCVNLFQHNLNTTKISSLALLTLYDYYFSNILNAKSLGMDLSHLALVI